MNFSPTRRGMLASAAAAGAVLTTSLYGVASAQGVAGFPGSGQFDGSYDPRASDAQEGGQSTYNGSIAVILLDRFLVQSALPADFRLAERTDSGNTHPVIHLVGHQLELMLLKGGVPQPSGAPAYQEMILLIPFVNRGSGSKWHTFALRMYLDQVAEVAIGNITFAYAKVLGQLAEIGLPDDLTTRITVLLRVFEGNLRRTGPWRTLDNARMTLPPWKDLQEIFKMPVVGADVTLGAVVRTVCSYWEWDYTNAEVAPATSRHQFLQSLRDGMDSWVQLGPLSSDPNGTFAIRGLRWRLAAQPPACSF